MRDADGSPGANVRLMVKARLFAGAAAWALLAAAAPHAFAEASTPAGQPTPSSTAPSFMGGISQEPPRLPDRAAHGPVGEDNLSADEMFIEAESVVQDQSGHALIARGHVTARYQGRTLRAQEIIYDTQAGVITVNGHAEIISADGTVEYAEHAELDDKLHAGVATGFAARLEQNGKVAAASAVRRSDTVNELNRAIFTPCDICTSSGHPKQPTWSIQADKVIEDRDKQLVYYRHAVIKVFGIPIFYAPVFWHPDPTAKRQSGLLMPKLSVSNRRGVSYEQPYYWAISPYQDLVISPQINARVNPFLNLEWRKRFYSGQVDARVGYTYEKNFNNEGDKFGNATSRSYILADGAFDINQEWRWGFTAERASDDTLFDRYDIGGTYIDAGYFANDTRRLLSQLYTVKQSQNLFFSAAVVGFQSQRFYTLTDPANGQPVLCGPTSDPNQNVPPSLHVKPGVVFNCQPGQPIREAENDAALPNVTPILELRWEPRQKVLGGRLRIDASAVALERSEAELNPFLTQVQFDSLPPGPCFNLTSCPGVDYRRATLEADWRGALTTRFGARVEPFVSLRGDFYNVTDNILLGTKGGSFTRGTADAGVDVSYPLYRRFGDTSVVLEPIGEFVISPQADIIPNIGDEDSLVVEHDENALFRPDRFPGYDLYEGGARGYIGARSTINWGSGRYARTFFGRTWRDELAPALAAAGTSSGLFSPASDWVAAFWTSPFNGLTAWSRLAFAPDDWKVLRVEAAANWDVTPRSRGVVRYLFDDTSPFDPANPFQQGRREEIEAAGYFLLTKHWGGVFDATRDIRNGLWRRSEVGVLYQDECTRIELVYQRNETNPLGPTNAVLLRLNLATLGDAGYRNYDAR